MDRQDRDRLREKQNRLLELTKRRDPHLRISLDHPGSPTLMELEHYLFPKWESVIDAQIRWLEGRKETS